VREIGIIWESWLTEFPDEGSFAAADAGHF
jgi:hypothetical protein